MNKQEISRMIHEFQSEHTVGLLMSEVEELTNQIAIKDIEKVWDALYGVTCQSINGKALLYKHDVITALLCGVEGRHVSSSEFD